MSSTKSLKFDLRIYDPTEQDSRKGTQIKIKKADMNEVTFREILQKYFG